MVLIIDTGVFMSQIVDQYCCIQRKFVVEYLVGLKKKKPSNEKISRRLKNRFIKKKLKNRIVLSRKRSSFFSFSSRIVSSKYGFARIVWFFFLQFFFLLLKSYCVCPSNFQSETTYLPNFIIEFAIVVKQIEFRLDNEETKILIKFANPPTSALPVGSHPSSVCNLASVAVTQFVTVLFEKVRNLNSSKV